MAWVRAGSRLDPGHMRAGRPPEGRFRGSRPGGLGLLWHQCHRAWRRSPLQWCTGQGEQLAGAARGLAGRTWLAASHLSSACQQVRKQVPRDAGGAPRQAASRGPWDPGEWLASRPMCSARASLRWNGVRGAWHALGRALGSILALCQQSARQRGACVARDREAWASCGTNATARGAGVPSWGVLSGRRSSRAGGGTVPVGLGQLRAASDRNLRPAFHSHRVQGGQPLARPTQVAAGASATAYSVF